MEQATTNTNNHVYATIGDYEIKIRGEITDFAFSNTGDKLKIIEILNWGNLTLILNSFYGCVNLDVNSVSDIPYLEVLIADSFRDCRVLTWNNLIESLPVVDTLNIDRMFTNCFIFNENLNSWDVSNLTSLVQIFNNCKAFNYPLDNWQVGSVVDLSSLFRGALVFNQDLSSWDISNAENLSNMFNNARDYNQNLSNWDFSNVKDMSGFMLNKSLYDANYLSDLLSKLDQDLVFANMINVNLDFGTIKYDSTGFTAYNSLVSKGFIITSGGQV